MAEAAHELVDLHRRFEYACCREFGLSLKTVGKVGGELEPCEAQKRICELEMENVFLAKAAALFAKDGGSRTLSVRAG